MLAKKPEIVILTNTENQRLIKEICAGIEEEGLLYRCEMDSRLDTKLLAKTAAEESTIGVGIGIVGKTAVLTARDLEVEKPLHMVSADDLETARILGKNAARFIKKQPLKV